MTDMAAGNSKPSKETEGEIEWLVGVADRLLKNFAARSPKSELEAARMVNALREVVNLLRYRSSNVAWDLRSLLRFHWKERDNEFSRGLYSSLADGDEERRERRRNSAADLVVALAEQFDPDLARILQQHREALIDTLVAGNEGGRKRATIKLFDLVGVNPKKMHDRPENGGFLQWPKRKRGLAISRRK